KGDQTYAVRRFGDEVNRLYGVMNNRLYDRRYLAGDTYTIADMAVWPWYGALARGLLYDAGEFLDVGSYTHVVRWTEEIGRRPAAKRGRMVNRAWGEPASQLLERHDASDFQLRTQDKLKAG
ncbi:MAG TPA: glutathione binding-like protein, partial [Nevskiaceae bacterium]|nr:glutathione binding-like protein [Nevskiaceae bacterium]